MRRNSSRMLSSFFVIVSLLLQTEITAFSAPSSKIESSFLPTQLKFAQTKISLGKIFRGQKVPISFAFENPTDKPISILSLHSNCGCGRMTVENDQAVTKTAAPEKELQTNSESTVAEKDSELAEEPKAIFLPRQSGSIRFIFDSTLFTGNIVRTVTVQTSDSDTRGVILTLSAEIISEIDAIPPLLSLGQVKQIEEKEITIKVNPKAPGAETPIHPTSLLNLEKIHPQIFKKLATNPNPEIQILGITTSDPSIQAEWIPDETGASKGVIKVNFPKSLPPGAMREQLTLWNTSTHAKELVIPIIAEVQDHVSLSARYVEFGVVEPQKNSGRSITIQSLRADFAVTKTLAKIRKTKATEELSEDQILKVVTQKKGDQTELLFSLTYPKELHLRTKVANISGELLIDTNDPEYKQIKVPFFGVLKQD